MAAAAHAGGKPPNIHNKNKSSSGRPPPPPPPLHAKSRRTNRHGQQQRYFGRMASNVTDHLKKVVPSHAFHPSLLRLPAPSYHRKASSISDYIERQVRPPPQSHRPFTAPDAYFGRRASNVTDHLRYIPPSHLGLHAHSKSLPYFGRLATSVTDPSKFEASDGDHDPITSHWSRSRPSSARLPISPQHVSKEVLFSALSARGDHPPSTGRRPTHIASLLKHQFSHLLGDDAPAASPRATQRHAIKPAADCASARAKRPDTAPAPANTKRGTPSTLHSHASAPLAADQQQQHMVSNSPRIKDHMSAASPRPLSARSSNLSGADKRGAAPKLNKHTNNVNAQVEPSPRSRRATKGGNVEEMMSARNRSSTEETRSGSSNMQVEDEGDGGVSARNRQEAEGYGGVEGEGGEQELEEGKDMEMEMEHAAVEEAAGRLGQKSRCDDGSEEELGPEKLEFVSKWVQQERPPALEWSSPKAIDKVVNHSRRATSITKYNIW